MKTGLHKIRLGVNIDHVATLRNARGGVFPDPVAAAQLALAGGADGITAHLREDRRHIRDDDMKRLKAEVPLPLNFEMAATEEMLGIALAIRPNAVCLVPEKREERTTEGGLDVASQEEYLTDYCAKLTAVGIRVSLFVNADDVQLEAAKKVGAAIVELHTGHYAELAGEGQMLELQRLRGAARIGAQLGLEVHAGHGLTFDNVAMVAAIPELHELNIGHFLIGASVAMGLKAAVEEMRRIIDGARA